jgi:hypothetical protein
LPSNCNYLPAFGVYFALASSGIWMLTHVHARVVGTLALVLVLVLGCAPFTAQRTLIWGSEAKLYAHAARTRIPSVPGLGLPVSSLQA